jgi:hypothetical protein
VSFSRIVRFELGKKEFGSDISAGWDFGLLIRVGYENGKALSKSVGGQSFDHVICTNTCLSNVGRLFSSSKFSEVLDKGTSSCSKTVAHLTTTHTMLKII